MALALYALYLLYRSPHDLFLSIETIGTNGPLVLARLWCNSWSPRLHNKHIPRHAHTWCTRGPKCEKQSYCRCFYNVSQSLTLAHSHVAPLTYRTWQWAPYLSTDSICPHAFITLRRLCVLHLHAHTINIYVFNAHVIFREKWHASDFQEHMKAPKIAIMVYSRHLLARTD